MTERIATRRIATPGSASSGRWDDEEQAAEQSFKRLTREEAAALRAGNPMVSPWRVIAAQGAVGLAVAGLVWLVTGRIEWLASALYGAATAVIPGALMARGMTSRLSSLSPAVSAASVLGWGFVKLAVSVAMLVLAPRLVQPLSWPALLVALGACTAVYWVALSWRGKKSS
jgi:ATP synthase protein I